MNRSYGEKTHVVDWVKFYGGFVRTSTKYDRANKHGLRITEIHNKHFSPYRQKIIVVRLTGQYSATVCWTGWMVNTVDHVTWQTRCYKYVYKHVLYIDHAFHQLCTRIRANAYVHMRLRAQCHFFFKKFVNDFLTIFSRLCDKNSYDKNPPQLLWWCNYNHEYSDNYAEIVYMQEHSSFTIFLKNILEPVSFAYMSASKTLR